MDDSVIRFTKCKSVLNKDLSYRPPKSTKVKSENTSFLEKSDRFEDGSRFHSGDLAQDHVSNISGDDVSWLLDQQRSMVQDDSREEGKDNGDTIEMTMDKEIKKIIQKLRTASVFDKTKK